MTIAWRTDITASDPPRVVRLCEATGFFTPDESAMAGRLLETALREGPSAGYDFVVAADGNEIAGYTCFGLIDGTESAYDLFWIVVDPALARAGA